MPFCLRDRESGWIRMISSLSLSLVGLAFSASAETPGRVDLSLDDRVFRFEYRIEVPSTHGTDAPVHVFVPIASDSDAQSILAFEVESDLEGAIETEAEYGNRFWHGVVPADRIASTKIGFLYTVKRRVVRAGEARDDETSVGKFLSSNERVAVAHPILDPILEEIRANSKGAAPSVRARAIYDWVVDNVEYKKVGNGWGNGDTFWACNERYGNCTDFHSLFISLARTEGIPARFEMGFPIPADRGKGGISGYHCWVEFWLPDDGWVPIDASEAFKHPEKRELFYGTHPADRLHFTTGRDLRLGSAHLDRPLNYFVYPYVEVAGKRTPIEIKTEFRYRDIAPDEISERGQENWEPTAAMR